jgi:DNA-binding MarR family transcriptional regulator
VIGFIEDVGKASERSEAGLVSLITQISKGLHRRTSEDVLGMRLKSFLLLSHVRDHPGVTQQELETYLMVDANAIVLLLNELEAAGFSVRRRDPGDRRRHLVELTPSGRQALERAEKARDRLEAELMEDLTPAERATLYQLLKRVLEGLLQPASEARS